MLENRKVALERMAKAFNEWMRRYTENPEQFTREFQAVTKFQKQWAEGIIPSYGDECAAYFISLLDEIPVAA
jgi:hypothetical protein